MEITLYRKTKNDICTIGKMYIDGVYFSDTLEDMDRGLDDSMSVQEIKDKKIYGNTAIPSGTYDISLDIISPKFSSYPFYMEVCNGKLPRVMNVKGFEGILIHVADGKKGADLIQGCIGVGKNTISNGLTEGKNTFRKLYEKLYEAYKENEPIKLTIKS